MLKQIFNYLIFHFLTFFHYFCDTEQDRQYTFTPLQNDVGSDFISNALKLIILYVHLSAIGAPFRHT